MAAFHSDERGDPPGAVDPLDVGGGERHFQVRGMTGDHPFDQVDLLERRLHNVAALQFVRYPDRPELSADATGAQSRDVGHQRDRACAAFELRRVRRQVDGRQPALRPLPEFPGQVIVSVDQRRPGEHPVDTRRNVDAGCGGNAGRREQAREQCGRACTRPSLAPMVEGHGHEGHGTGLNSRSG